LSNDSSFQAAFPSSLLKILYHNQISERRFRLNICKEGFMTVPVVFYTVKDFYMLNEMNEKIEMFKASGLTNFWSHENIDIKFLNYKEDKSPKVFTLSQFAGAFKVLLFGLSVSFVVFVVENVKTYVMS
jgi:hypothetical protein